MKILVALIVTAALLTGCASTHKSPAQTFRPKGAESVITITGSIERNDKVLVVDHMLIVNFNGVPVINGTIQDGNHDITGTYNGKPALALCNRQGSFNAQYSIHCRIVIDGEFATTLTF